MIQWTALHHAAERGQQGTVQLLLDRGADVASRTTSEETALRLVKRGRHEAVVQVLEGSLVARGFREKNSGTTTCSYFSAPTLNTRL